MNTVKITEKQQEVCGVIIEVNQVILFLLILNRLNIKQALQEISVAEKITDDDGNEVDNPKYDATKGGKNETEVVILPKYLSNLWGRLNIPLIDCEVELILTWSKNFDLADMTTKDAEGSNPAIVAPIKLEFKIRDNLYVPVVTLSKENEAKILEQLKTGFKRTIKGK